MDPLGIAAGVAGLATVAYKLSKTIYTGTEAVHEADTTLLQLQSEVDALYSALKNVSSVLESEDVVQFFNKKDQLASQSAKMMTSIPSLVKDCEDTLRTLDQILGAINGKLQTIPTIMRKPVKAMRHSVKATNVERVRHQIRSHTSAMQMTLHMINICLLVESQKQTENVEAGLNRQLGSLRAQIDDVQAKLSQAQISFSSSDEAYAITEENDQTSFRHIKSHVQVAQSIFSAGSIYAQSVIGTTVADTDSFSDVDDIILPLGSVIGLNAEQERRINQWLPEDPGIDDEENDIDEDFDKGIFEERITIARAKLTAEQYEAAETQLRACLADTAMIKTLPDHTVIDIKLDLVRALRGTGDNVGQIDILQGLLQGDLSKSQKLHIKHDLACSLFESSKFVMALHYAAQAMRGRQKLYGRDDESFLSSVRLMANICIGQDDAETATVYLNLLPPSEQKIYSRKFSTTGESLAAMTFLKKQGLEEIDSFTFFKALKLAKDMQNTVVIRYLLERPPALEAKDQEGATPLFYASLSGFADMVSHLLDVGADINAVNRAGFTALYYAEEHVEVMNILLERGASADMQQRGPSLLLKACQRNDEAAVRLLLHRGAKCTVEFVNGRTSPLHVASISGYEEIVLLLLEGGADVDIAGSNGWTPLMSAVSRQRDKMVKLLLDHGADVRKKNWSGQTTSDLAKRWTSEDRGRRIRNTLQEAKQRQVKPRSVFGFLKPK